MSKYFITLNDRVMFHVSKKKQRKNINHLKKYLFIKRISRLSLTFNYINYKYNNKKKSNKLISIYI